VHEQRRLSLMECRDRADEGANPERRNSLQLTTSGAAHLGLPQEALVLYAVLHVVLCCSSPTPHTPFSPFATLLRNLSDNFGSLISFGLYSFSYGSQ
jgi:hypothetical protein